MKTPQKVLDRNRAYYLENKEKIRKQKAERRKNNLIKAKEYLGGKCVGCGSTTDLQFDHIDRKNKSYAITKRSLNPFESLKEELDKCQLLCEKCHQIKTTVNHDTSQLYDGFRVESVLTEGDDKVIIILIRDKY